MDLTLLMVLQDNAMEEWGYKKAITIQTYSNCHPVVAPMNLLSLPLYFVIQKCCKSSNIYKFATTREVKQEMSYNKRCFVLSFAVAVLHHRWLLR